MKIFSSLTKGTRNLVAKLPVGKRIEQGIMDGKEASSIKFKGLPSANSTLMDTYTQAAKQNGIRTAVHIAQDFKFQEVLEKYAKKNNIAVKDVIGKSEDEIIEAILHKSGVGPCKFAQIISSDADMMSKFSPRVQEIIKKTQSENPFSRNLGEAQSVVNNAFGTGRKALPQAGANTTVPILANESSTCEIQLVKPLSAGTVGEAYLAKTADGKEVIVKMVKKGVDQEQLDLEEKIFTRVLEEISPSTKLARRQTRMLRNLYTDWSKELNFSEEYNYNKLLQKGASRYKVADITAISPDKSCIVMEKAEGIQMNSLMKMLKDYKANPTQYSEKYAKEISENPWLADPKKVMNETPDAITKAFDEMLLFLNKDGKSIMHGDPHMGNYFMTQGANGKLIPMFIDTGNCVIRDGMQISNDLKFLTNYFVGNPKGLAKYFMKQCERDSEPVVKVFNSTGLMTIKDAARTVAKDELTAVRTLSDKDLEAKIAKEISETIFSRKQNTSDVNNVMNTIQAILDKNGLSINPETATAMKSQLQFYTGISEAAALTDNTLNVMTIMKDVPHALKCMLQNRMNPFTTIGEATQFAYKNQTAATRNIYQFLSKPTTVYDISFSKAPKMQEALTTVNKNRMVTIA